MHNCNTFSQVTLLVRTVLPGDGESLEAVDGEHYDKLNPLCDDEHCQELAFNTQDAIFASIERHWIVEVVSSANPTGVREAYVRAAYKEQGVEHDEYDLHGSIESLFAL